MDDIALTRKRRTEIVVIIIEGTTEALTRKQPWQIKGFQMGVLKC